MDFFKNEYLKKEKEYLKHVKKEYIDIVQEAEKNNTRIDTKIASQPMNSWENNLMRSHITDEYLIKRIEHALSNAGDEFIEYGKYEFGVGYDDSIKHKWIHILLKRFKEKVVQV